MHRHIFSVVFVVLSATFISGHVLLNYQMISALAPVPTEPVAEDTISKPDFTAYSGRERKKAFFAFLSPYIEEENKRVMSLRAQIQSKQLDATQLLSLAKKYRIKSKNPDSIHQQLMMKIGAIPPSLVLSQAAIESAWGTSRFASEGNNYFGQWCFRPGCGLVPSARQEGKQHEVRVFPSPKESVAAYIHNLNSHPAYRELRAFRAELRNKQISSSGCYLAQGLEDYSEKGHQYVETLKRLIRSNKLEQDPAGHCAPVMLAEEEAAPSVETPSEPTKKQTSETTTVATDDQTALDPSPEGDIVPSS